MNFVVFDTETTSIDAHPFCYNIGYVIGNESEILLKRDFVVEQVWHNLPLFESAYYKEKRPKYVDSMRKHETIMDKFGYICQTMYRDFKANNVECAFAFNSPFDDKVFNFNCDWYKCKNPFDDINIIDIRGYVHNFIVNDDYRKFCEENGYFTESGNYSTTAETVYRYLFDNDFEEEHTALSDSLIERDILLACVQRGAVLGNNYSVARSISRTVERTLHIKTREQTDYYFDYEKIRINGERTEIVLK